MGRRQNTGKETEGRRRNTGKVENKDRRPENKPIKQIRQGGNDRAEVPEVPGDHQGDREVHDQQCGDKAASSSNKRKIRDMCESEPEPESERKKKFKKIYKNESTSVISNVLVEKSEKSENNNKHQTRNKPKRKNKEI